MIPIAEVRPATTTNGPDCSDHDEDCESIADKGHCWLHAPERGMCPFLRSTPSQEAE